LQDFVHFPQFFTIFDDFSEFRSTFGTLHFGKSSNTANIFEKMKKNLAIIILLLKWSLLEPKMFTLAVAIQYGLQLLVACSMKIFICL